MQPLAYTITDAVKVARVSQRTLYEAAAAGALRMKKLGTKNLILHQALQDYLDGLPDWQPEPAAKPKKPRGK